MDSSPKRSDKAREIACAALDYFTQKGFQNTSLEKIAAGAGIGKSTIYEYYRSKEALFMAAINEASEQWFERIDAIARQTEEPIERLERIAYAFMDCDEGKPVTSQRFYFEIVMQTIMVGGVFHERRHFIHQLHRKIIAGIVDILLAGVSRGQLKAQIARDAHKIAVTFLSFLDGMTLYALAGGEYIDVRGQIDFFIRHLAPLLYPDECVRRFGDEENPTPIHASKAK
jgi:AcrR family transcriptional regulator